MSSYAIKQRYRRAVKMALKELQKKNMQAFRVEGDADIIVVDPLSHAKIIKICLDDWQVPKLNKRANIPMEIWVRKKGEKEFRKIPF